MMADSWGPPTTPRWSASTPRWRHTTPSTPRWRPWNSTPHPWATPHTSPRPKLLQLLSNEITSGLEEKKKVLWKKWKKKARRKRKKEMKVKWWEETAVGISPNASAAFPVKSVTATTMELRVWVGEVEGEVVGVRGAGGDHLTLGVWGGRVVVAWDLGSGPGRVVAVVEEGVEGRWHRVKVKRYHRDLQVVVDGGEGVRGRSGGRHKSLNVEQVLVVGGRGEGGVRGCLAGLKVAGRKVEVEGGQPCEGACRGCRGRHRRGRRKKNLYP